MCPQSQLWGLGLPLNPSLPSELEARVPQWVCFPKVRHLWVRLWALGQSLSPPLPFKQQAPAPEAQCAGEMGLEGSISHWKSGGSNSQNLSKGKNPDSWVSGSGGVLAPSSPPIWSGCSGEAWPRGWTPGVWQGSTKSVVGVLKASASRISSGKAQSVGKGKVYGKRGGCSEGII